MFKKSDLIRFRTHKNKLISVSKDDEIIACCNSQAKFEDLHNPIKSIKMI